MGRASGTGPIDPPKNGPPWGILAAVLLVVGVGGVLLIPRMTTNPAPPTGVTPTSNAGTPPDLSSMTPRERATRLFDRIASAADRGDTSEVSFFAPMALQAYAALNADDNDLLYDTGIILALSGDTENASARADSLLARVPGHLLGLVIQATVAEVTGDEAGLTDARRDFLESYEAEIGVARTEYEAHRTTIEEFRSAAENAARGQ